MSFGPLVLIFIIMYLFVFRPQNKRAKEHRDMVDALKRGDRVITGGGLIGTVAKVIDANEVLVEISSGIEVRVVKQSISQVVSKTPGALTDKTKAEDPADGEPAGKKLLAPVKKLPTKTVRKDTKKPSK
jgi:preprotein translocase subunit YajC